ncbi:DUF4831 family protein [Dysgonomonas sp. Marseille-P4677]|uniref:DUF4831 family protein n=1 Tax=Dysgonomonas sp. Marseille-P4677 TaxID=2364790 RepID=UPI0019117918|nr:DUF4831 family protein [Dysgonomonas sp. Marseille-P4677]MBK5719707.1 DUF4831 family protein [Dysgonomonas sp. Marseille-P4677]
MKYHVSLLLLFITSTLCAQNTVKMSAVKSNDYGVAYSLPKTSLVVTVEYTKKTRKVGEFYQYAERYLSISNPIIENATSYILDNIDVTIKGIPDKDKSYLVEFRSNTTAPFVTLTKDGLICAINDDYTFTKDEAVKADVVSSPSLPDPRSFLSEEILRAGSTAKQAELIAKQIYRLRESRNNILTGDADNMPPDGNAYQLVMSQLEEQEKALSAMFTGTEAVEKGYKSFTVIPDERDIDNRIIFRFSSKLGVVDANDLSGQPVTLSLKNKDPREVPVLTPKEEKDLEKKFSAGIIYNIPNKAALQITYNGRTYVQKECDVVQYGVQDVLAPKMFDNNKLPIKVIFYSEMGAIKQIIQ